MSTIQFDRYEVIEENGELKVILYAKPQLESYYTEFASELGSLDKNPNELNSKARQFVKKHLPKLKLATIVVVAGSIILGSFPLQKASAHEVDFNMTYLYFGNTKTYISQIDQTYGNINHVSPSYFDLNTDGSLKITSQFDPTFVKEMHNRGIKVVPFLSNHWDRSLGRAALANREELADQIAKFIVDNNLDGVQVDIENVTDIDRSNYTEFVKLLTEKIPKEKEVSVAVAANPNNWTKGWHGSYDYKELGKYADYLMIMAYDESYTGGPEGPVASYGWVERSIQYALNQGVAGEKIVLGIPFYGRYWKEGAASGGDGISNKRVDELLAKYGGTVTFDNISQSPKATITIKEGQPTTTIAGKVFGPGTYHIWFENHDSIKAKLQLIHKYNLKGSGSWSLGQESTSIWQHYRTWMSHSGELVVTPTNPYQPKESTGDVEPTIHVVQSGDSLWKIASNYHLSVDQLKQYNSLSSDVIYVGQKLNLLPVPNPVVVTPAAPVKQQPIVTKPPSSTPGAISAPTPSTIKKPTAAPKTTVVQKTNLVNKSMIPKVNNTYMRSAASTKNKIVKKLTTKDTVKVIQQYTDSTKKEWLKVKIGNTTGWVYASQLKQKPATVVATKKYPILKLGSKGTAVKDLQNKLIKAKVYKGKAHGSYDKATKAAVVKFQQKYKLKQDGIAGQATFTKLDAILKTK
ncbi:glycosyl hydrolase family 18 protein [Salirhabdus sp. Marseille-P4669]|uniref:glycosyl hydrolase family 18 protein n=1 Tax=Salirhabdus sp. Marseille-P4669 TaxID=2042310 RepID=UPI000C7B5E30|nr:glycosyl hydrolase family 18 protein [Salirhabdus sp. Marseille-P4669]